MGQGRHKAWSSKELLSIRNSFVNGAKQSQLAAKYNTTQKTISKIVNLETYDDIGVPTNYANLYYSRTGKPLYDGI